MVFCVVVFDYELGNVYFVVKVLVVVGVDVVLMWDCVVVFEVDGFVVFGVGVFQVVCDVFFVYGGDEIIGCWFVGGCFVFGICVGMQVLFEYGVECGYDMVGFGEWLGVVIEFNVFVLLYMGWNIVEFGVDSVFFCGIEQEWFYFVYFYVVQFWEFDVILLFLQFVLMWVIYGDLFFVVVENGLFLVMQFYLEKLGEVGIQLLWNWVGSF